MGTINDVLRLIDALPSAELERVRKHISARLAHGIAAEGRATKEQSIAQSLLIIIADECHRKGVDVRASTSRLSKGRGYPAFRQNVEGEHGVASFLQCAAIRSKVRTLALARVAIDLLIENLIDMNVAISAGTVMSHIHRIPAVLNLAFPGYAASGLLHLVVRKEE